MSEQKQTPQQPQKGSSKFLLEYGPLILFFVVNAKYGIYWGTGVLVVSTLIALAISWVKDKHIPKLLAFGCAAVVFFGALTLIFEDETFIKIKPTVVSLIFAGGLLIGHILGKNPLKMIMGESMSIALPDQAWGKLTMLWIVMFSTVALANEVAWRTLSTDNWVTFKVFGLTGISLFFAVLIAIFLSKYAAQESNDQT